MKIINLFSVAFFLFVLSACASVSIADAPAVERSIAWDKTRTIAETETICKNVGDYANKNNVRSCHYFAENICHVVSTDLISELEVFGEALAKCYKADPSKDSVLLSGFVKSNNKKNRSIIWHSMNTYDADKVCRKINGEQHWKHVYGCRYYDNGNHIISSDSRAVGGVGEMENLGHEAKHVFDGRWHDTFGIPKPRAFTGTNW